MSTGECNIVTKLSTCTYGVKTMSTGKRAPEMGALLYGPAQIYCKMLWCLYLKYFSLVYKHVTFSKMGVVFIGTAVHVILSQDSLV